MATMKRIPVAALTDRGTIEAIIYEETAIHNVMMNIAREVFPDRP